jgi:hypothetical protein
MATFEITEGAPGQGKSLYTARLATRLAKRNRKWAVAGFPLRLLASNLRFCKSFEEKYGLYDPSKPIDHTNGMILYWDNPIELIKFRHLDIIWDEIATELDSRDFATLSRELKRFLSQYRKRGVDIYANTQDFSMIDARARLMISGVKTLKKVMGSPDPSTSKPTIKRIWGLTLIRGVQNFREVAPEKKQYSFFDFSFMFIERELVELYDTAQDIMRGAPAPLQHEVMVCERHGEGCDFRKVMHS